VAEHAPVEGEVTAVDTATEIKCAICKTPRSEKPSVEWLHCPRCELVYCAPCVEEARHEQWQSGEAATVSCKECGGILLTHLG